MYFFLPDFNLSIAENGLSPTSTVEKRLDEKLNTRKIRAALVEGSSDRINHHQTGWHSICSIILGVVEKSASKVRLSLRAFHYCINWTLLLNGYMEEPLITEDGTVRESIISSRAASVDSRGSAGIALRDRSEIFAV